MKRVLPLVASVHSSTTDTIENPILQTVHGIKHHDVVDWDKADDQANPAIGNMEPN
jgi:hypothetical protein